MFRSKPNQRTRLSAILSATCTPLEHDVRTPEISDLPTLYYSPGSCALAPHILLEEIGRPFELSLVLTGAGQTRTPEFHRVNPKGRVPVLVTGDRVLTEAPAILFDLALSSPEADLVPTLEDGVVRCLEWFNWLSGTVHSVAVRQVWRPEDFSHDATHRDAIVASGEEHLANAFELIEERMSHSQWAVGDRYCLVDPYLLVFYRWGNRMRIQMSAKYPSWTAHAHRLAVRPAVARALAKEEISLWE
jgi:glutathione S-transferase